MLVSTVMAEEGVVDDANRTLTKKVGMLTAKLYREQHGKRPLTQYQEVNGMYMRVSTYTEEDRNLILRAIEECT